MTRKVPKWFLILAVIGVSITTLTLISYGWDCFTRPFTGRLVDSNGKPIQGAFVIYLYESEWPNPGGAGENIFASGILETDKQGQFRISSRFCPFLPLFETKPYPMVDLAYSAKTRCVSRGAFLGDFNDTEMNVHQVTLPDATGDLQLRAAA